MGQENNRTIHIRYFALLREQRGLSQETLQSGAATPEELYLELKSSYRFTLPLDSIKVSINNVFQPLDSILKDQDHLVFIPPVAGG